MTATAVTRMGGTTSPLQVPMINAARLIFDACGVNISENRISRMVRRFINWSPAAGGEIFFQYIANEVQLSEQQRRAAFDHPDVARVISYLDPTGEAAVNNVLRESRR